MPYEIITNAEGCNGFAVVKVGEQEPVAGGCYTNENDAQAYADALNIATSDEQRSRDQALIIDIDDTIISNGKPLRKRINYINSLENYKIVVTGRFAADKTQTVADLADAGLEYDELIMNPGGDPVEHKRETAKKILERMPVAGAFENYDDAQQAYIALGIDAIDPTTLDELGTEERAVDLSPPEYVRENCRRGLSYYEEGFAGDGLKAKTVAEARNIAAGKTISEDKVIRMRAWIARHLVDLDNAPEPSDDDYPSPGQVAHLLWGSGTTRNAAQKTYDWTNIKVRQIELERETEEDRADGPASKPAPKKDQVFGSEENPAGSAEGKQGGIELSESVEKSLANKATTHNDKMTENGRPDWTRVTVGALRSVYRRGAGAFSTSHRPGMTRGQWAMGRVNAFLYLAEKGKPENKNYVGDNDLLHKDHPKYSDTNSRSDTMNTETRELPPSYRPASSEDVPVLRPSCMSCEHFESDQSYCEKWSAEVQPDYYCDAYCPEEESPEEETPEMEEEPMMEELSNLWITRSLDEKRTVAYTTIECRAMGDGNTLVGYAALFDTPSHDLGGFVEYVSPGAFRKTLNDGADVRLLIDHEGAPLARTKSGTMRLIEDERGLRVEADLDPANPVAAGVISALKRGDMNQMSFAFRTVKDEWSRDRATRTLKEVRLFDVSVVTFPAYEATVAEVRGMLDNTTAPSGNILRRKRQIQIAAL